MSGANGNQGADQMQQPKEKFEKQIKLIDKLLEDYKKENAYQVNIFNELLIDASFHPFRNDILITLSQVKNLEKEKIEIFAHPSQETARKESLKGASEIYNPIKDHLYWNFYGEKELTKEEIEVDLVPSKEEVCLKANSHYKLTFWNFKDSLKKQSELVFKNISIREAISFSTCGKYYYSMLKVNNEELKLEEEKNTELLQKMHILMINLDNYETKLQNLGENYPATESLYTSSFLFWNCQYLLTDTYPKKMINLKENKMDEKLNTYIQEALSGASFSYIFISETDKRNIYFLTDSFTKIKYANVETSQTGLFLDDLYKYLNMNIFQIATFFTEADKKGKAHETIAKLDTNSKKFMAYKNLFLERFRTYKFNEVCKEDETDKFKDVIELSDTKGLYLRFDGNGFSIWTNEKESFDLVHTYRCNNIFDSAQTQIAHEINNKFYWLKVDTEKEIKVYDLNNMGIIPNSYMFDDSYGAQVLYFLLYQKGVLYLGNLSLTSNHIGVTEINNLQYSSVNRIISMRSINSASFWFQTPNLIMQYDTSSDQSKFSYNLNSYLPFVYTYSCYLLARQRNSQYYQIFDIGLNLTNSNEIQIKDKIVNFYYLAATYTTNLSINAKWVVQTTKKCLIYENFQKEPHSIELDPTYFYLYQDFALQFSYYTYLYNTVAKKSFQINECGSMIRIIGQTKDIKLDNYFSIYANSAGEYCMYYFKLPIVNHTNYDNTYTDLLKFYKKDQLVQLAWDGSTLLYLTEDKELKRNKMKVQDKIVFENQKYFQYFALSEDKSVVLASDQNIENYYSQDNLTGVTLNLSGSHCVKEDFTFKIPEEGISNFYLFDMQVKNSKAVMLIYLTYNSEKKTFKLNCINDHVHHDKLQNSETYKALMKEKINEQYEIGSVCNQYKFKFIGSTFFMQYKNLIEYIDTQGYIRKIDCFQYYGDLQAVRIYKTENPQVFQIYFNLTQAQFSGKSFLTCWDIYHHEESQLKEYESGSYTYVRASSNQQFNYTIQTAKDAVYNILYPTPLYKYVLFNNQSISFSMDSISFDVPLVSDNLSNVLMSMSQSVQSYNQYNLLYFQSLLTNIKAGTLKDEDIDLEQFFCYFPGSSPLRLFDDDNYDLLEKMLKKIKFVDNDKQTKYFEIFCQLLYPDSSHVSGLDKAIQNRDVELVDILFQGLNKLPEIPISKFILKKHFCTLANFQLKSFETYVASCTYENSLLKDLQYIEWTYDEDYILHYNPTMAITPYYMTYLKTYGLSYFQRKRILRDKKKLEEAKTTDAKKEENKEAAVTQAPPASVPEEEKKDGPQEESQLEGLLKHENLSDNLVQVKAESANKNRINPMKIPKEKKPFYMIDENEEISDEEEETDESVEQKKVDIQAIEFDWIFRGNNAKNFISQLVELENENIFQIDTVRYSIEFLWNRFYRIIFKQIFIPYTIYIAIFIAFATYGSKVGLAKHDQGDYAWYIIQYVMLGLIGLGMLYYIYREVQQLFYLGTKYFSSLFNYVDCAVLAINITYIICYFNEVELQQLRVLSSIAIFMNWIKLFDFLRIFQPTSAFMRMIAQILNDMKIFSLFLFISFFCIGNSFYVLSRKFTPEDEAFMDETFNFGDAILYGYNYALGNFNTDGFANNEYTWLLWILFIICAFVVQIVFMNLLISIMGDTYGSIKEKFEISKFKEICNNIYQYEFLYDREKIFGNQRYILVAKVQSSSNASELQWDGMVANLKTSFNSSINEATKNIKEGQEELQRNIIKWHEKHEPSIQQIEVMQQSFNDKFQELYNKIDALAGKR